MKCPTKSAISGFLLFFAALCFPQSESRVRESPPESREEAKIPAPAPNAIFPAIVARVNGEAIPGRDLEELVRHDLSSIGSPEWKNLRREYRGELTLTNITALINSKLLYQKAKATGVKVTDADVQSELQKIAKTYKSEAEMNAALASQNRDRASLEKSLYENLTTSKYVEATIRKKTLVTPEELAKAYSNNSDEFSHPDIVRTSHILIRAAADTPEQDAAARQRAEALLARANKGEEFAKLARENSMDSSASRGGDLGFTSRDALAPEYAEAAFSLPLGAVSLVKTQYDYQIIKVIDKKKEGLFTLEEVKPQLKEHMENQKYQEELNKLVKQLREEANIEILISAGELLNP